MKTTVSFTKEAAGKNAKIQIAKTTGFITFRIAKTLLRKLVLGIKLGSKLEMGKYSWKALIGRIDNKSNSAKLKPKKHHGSVVIVLSNPPNLSLPQFGSYGVLSEHMHIMILTLRPATGKTLRVKATVRY